MIGRLYETTALSAEATLGPSVLLATSVRSAGCDVWFRHKDEEDDRFPACKQGRNGRCVYILSVDLKPFGPWSARGRHCKLMLEVFLAIPGVGKHRLL